ncbi:hypothetical protein FDO65_05995 [Nakamurella flava]|uniref:Uncharacterized protein n=1 Tax=Nakamurella flava TaxID=2576308 RepID=A0A4U6QM11_9ACTN|nr:hypothetical protein [Nakamurella flava]TKV61178.1 hypothetical protein FDO65_05995 [Nakamurella flava]
MILNILLLLSMVALLTVVPLLPGLITARLVRTELVRTPGGAPDLFAAPAPTPARAGGCGRRPSPSPSRIRDIVGAVPNGGASGAGRVSDRPVRTVDDRTVGAAR